MFSMVLLKTNKSKRASSVFPKRRGLLSSSQVCRMDCGPGGNRGHVTVANYPVVGTHQMVFLVANEGGTRIIRRVCASNSAKPTTCVTRRTGGMRLFLSSCTTTGVGERRVPS